MSSVQTQGTTLEVHNSSGVFISVGEVTDITGPGGQAAEIDTTNLSSTAKEYNIGLKDEGQVTLELNYDPSDTGQDRLIALYDAQTSDTFKITLQDSGSETWTFDAYVMGRPITINRDDVVKMSITLRITGAVTIA